MIKNFSSLTKVTGILFSPVALSIFSLFFPLENVNAITQVKQSPPSIICQSQDGRTRRCRFDTRNGVVLIRQLSRTSCRGNWNYHRGYIEVRNGCRAEFIEGRRNKPSPRPPDYDESIICESRDGRTNRCRFDTRDGVILIRQLSNSSCRGNWSYGRGYIQVRNGCRGKFTRDFYNRYPRRLSN